MKNASQIRAGRLRELSQVFPVGLLGSDAPNVFRARRAALLKSLEFPAVFSGLDREPGSEHIYRIPDARIFQEPAMLHLCGINQTGIRILLDPASKDPRSQAILFLPEKNPAREFWDGIRLGLLPMDSSEYDGVLSELKLLTGFESILPLQDFRSTLESLVALRKEPTIGVYYHSYLDRDGKLRENRSDRNWQFSREISRWIRPFGAEIRSIAETHLAQRLVLDPVRLKEAQQAQKWTREAFLAVLSDVPGMKSERILTARLESEMCARSSWGLAFPTICATGRNACTLHYMKNDEPLDPKGLVLLDFGCRSAGMHSDISRTVPVCGTYSPLQRMLYEIVLDAQVFNQGNVRPGITIRELNSLVWQRLEDLLEERFLSRGGTCERVYVDGGVTPLPGKSKAHPRQPHGVSHLMAEAEHDGDPFRLYQDQTLQEGWMLSNEPGLYGHFRIRLAGKLHEEWIGIRIEDDLVVTSKGCINLSAAIPKHPDEIERCMAQRGIS
jgi:Xaa-Pro aminopeptidase